jgi:hypothetical protein
MAQIPEIYATTYANNVYMMAQQQGSLLYQHVTHIDMKGEMRTIERANPTAAQLVTSKLADTPNGDGVKFDRRVLKADAYHWSDILDWTEEQGMNPIVDPTGPITRAGALAMGRCMDSIIVNNGLAGVAYTGKTGTTQVALPDDQKIAVTYGGSSNSGLTLEKLLKARSILGKSNIPMKGPGQECVMVITQSQLDDLLKISQIQSADYNTVRALVAGEVDTFLGFKFVVLDGSILPVSSGTRSCFAFLKSNVVFGEPQPLKSEINQRPDKCNAWQVYMKLKAGSTRYEDTGVVQIECEEA